MATAWRIVSAHRRREAFYGEGARMYGGRWNSPGRRVVYTSEHAGAAALEVLVHMRPLLPPGRFVAIRATIPDDLIERFPESELPADWRSSPPGPSTMRIGDEWVRASTWPVLALPSVIVPSETNFLLNPLHPAFGRIIVGAAEVFAFDPRLLS